VIRARAVDRLDAHQEHEGPHMAAPHGDALALKHAGKASGPEEGMRQVQLVNPAHEQHICHVLPGLTRAPHERQ
jgi:hypothetical protein